ncbi:MAG: hypothetical protein M3M97_06815 [Actinomycetota bacterium]|nr:hypothetical protein [Actinomycetota bacterium]
MSVTRFWWLLLGLAAAVVAVVAMLLGRIIAAARSIDRHADAIWTVGKQIAGNTVSIWMLEKTSEQMEATRDATRSLEQTASSMDEKIRALADETGGGR